jgi:hypothetical protein
LGEEIPREPKDSQDEESEGETTDRHGGG